jgi:orotidine-5'-phosphate decarboxylase
MRAPFLISAAERLIVALGELPAARALGVLDGLPPRVGCAQLGAELFAPGGQTVLEAVARRGMRVMLGATLLPALEPLAARLSEQVSESGEPLRPLLTLSAWAGTAALQAAAQRVRAQAAGYGLPDPLVLGSGLPTSLADAELAGLLDGDQADLEGAAPRHRREALVARLAAACQRAGLDGMVAAGADLAAVRSAVGGGFVTVVAGIRSRGSAPDEHALVMTPIRALQGGGTMLVVGRPITQARDPGAAAATILREMEEAFLIA